MRRLCCDGLPHKGVERFFKSAAFGGLTAASLYVLLNAALLIYLSRILYLRDVMGASAKNNRGDLVRAKTEFSGSESHPSKTMITLKRTYRLFSTTLMEAYSYDYLVGLNWQDDDTLVLQLDFGCDGHHSAGVQTVGPMIRTSRGRRPRTARRTARRAKARAKTARAVRACSAVCGKPVRIRARRSPLEP